MKKDGVNFICNAEVGKNVSSDEVLKGHDAVVLAGGSTIPRNLPIPGRGFKRHLFCDGFFKAAKQARWRYCC